jgi:hypothetical protein
MDTAKVDPRLRGYDEIKIAFRLYCSGRHEWTLLTSVIPMKLY